MSPTVEARWFFPGPLPAAARDWFDSTGASMPAVQERADLYLVSLAPDAPNVKLRAVGDAEEQRLEIKTRAGTLRTQRLGPVDGSAAVQAVGRVGKWQKWRLPLAAHAPAADALGGSDDWLRVDKRRRVRPFAAESDAVQERVELARPAVGCDLELSEIDTRYGRYWSICFEAFGPSHDGLEAVLRHTAAHAFACGTPPALPAVRSIGYPELVARIARGTR